MSRYALEVPPLRDWPARWLAEYRWLLARYFTPYAVVWTPRRLRALLDCEVAS